VIAFDVDQAKVDALEGGQELYQAHRRGDRIAPLVANEQAATRPPTSPGWAKRTWC
jgi:hypothetical protein